MNINLLRVKRTDSRYQEIRDRHYVKNKGCFGQQIHYLILDSEDIIGIISGSSATYAVRSRDEYFGITAQNRQVALNSIVNNSVFRLEKHEMNLGTRVLKIWRNQISRDWEAAYGVRVHGFETFVQEEDYRKGSVYKADNWKLLGETNGSAKTHSGMGNKSERMGTTKKLIFAIKIPKTKLCDNYVSTWRGISPAIYGQTSLMEFID